MGCCLNPGFICNPNTFNIEFPPITFPNLPVIPSSSLTEAERDLLRRLGECWNLFTSLEKRSEADNSEFVDAIHRCQQIVALRVARRVDPEVWAQP
jgi:hypothetical protein